MRALLFGLVLSVVPLAAHAAGTEGEQAVRAVMAAQRDAWNRADLAAFMTGYWNDPSIRFASGDTVRTGWSETLARYRTDYPGAAGMGRLDFDLVEVRQVGPKVVYVFGKWNLKREKDEPHGLFTLIFEKKGARWLITRDHTS